MGQLEIELIQLSDEIHRRLVDDVGRDLRHARLATAARIARRIHPQPEHRFIGLPGVISSAPATSRSPFSG